jgi:DNA-binding IclR family transcriptional regulator
LIQRGRPVGELDQARILATIRRLHPEPVTSRELMSRFGMSRSQAARVLSDFTDIGVVRRIGKGSGSVYMALEPLPLYSRHVAPRPRRLGFLDELRRRRAEAGESDPEGQVAAEQ